ncbi:MAG: hypothetical protein H7Y89_13755 [Steroidobacteraceae bacterium]|nr:hypothetical protein [Steroidobacteraceae bacterium]
MVRHIGILVAALWVTGAQAQFSADLRAVSDYEFRGVSLSARDPALQASIDYTFGDSGFSAGVWASNVDFGADYDADVEVDYYADYERALNDTVTLYAGIALYTYPASDDVDTSPEAYAGFGAGGFELLQWFTDDYSALSQNALYTEANYTAAISDSLALVFHAGYSFGDAFEDSELLDYGVQLNYTAGNFVLGAKFVGTDASGNLEVSDDVFNNQPRFLVSISTTLPWEAD